MHGLDAIEALSLVSEVALAIDETTGEPGALERRRCTAVCLKLGRSGGITGLLDAARRARAAGYEVYLASTLDGPLGIAAALHAAVVIEPDRPCGLATLGLFESAPAAPVVRGGDGERAARSRSRGRVARLVSQRREGGLTGREPSLTAPR